MMQKKWAVRVIAIVLAVLMVATTLTVLLNVFTRTTLIISKKPGNTGISRDIRTEFTTDLLLSD